MSNNKKIIIAGIIVFAVFAYAHAFQNETQAQEPLIALDTTSSGGGTNQQGQEILALLADLKKVRLDESIFSDPKFQELQDFSMELNPEPKGRPNPFAPLGRDAVLNESTPGTAAVNPRNIPFNSEAATAATKSSKAVKK